MSNLIQPLKFQIVSQYKFFILNFLIAVIGLLIFRFAFSSITLELYSIIISLEVIFTFFLGWFNYQVLGKTYYSLKHDRRLFVLSTFIINLLNAFIIVIVFIINIALLGKPIIIINLVQYFLVMLLAFTFGCVYSLFISKYKIVNIAIVALILLFSIVFSTFVKDYIFNNVDQLFYGFSNLKYTFSTELNLIIHLVLFIVLNILTVFKYFVTYNK